MLPPYQPIGFHIQRCEDSRRWNRSAAESAAQIAPAGALLRMCRAFVMLHVAVVLATWKFARGEEAALWRDRVRAGTAPGKEVTV